jgi:hypothetical protein
MDTLITSPGITNGWDSFWLVITILTAVYEILVRAIPTIKDYTIIGFIYRVLDWLVENRAKLEPDEEISVSTGNSKKAVKKRFRIKPFIERIFD